MFGKSGKSGRAADSVRPWPWKRSGAHREWRSAGPWAIAVAWAAALATPAAAQDNAGRIAGRIVDAATARPLSNVQILVENTEIGTLSSVDGRYLIRDVPAGVQAVVVQLIGYGTKTLTGVSVEPGEVTALDIGLEQAAIAIAGITVEAAIEAGSTTALLTERQTESFVVDAIGADQISRSPDGDAAAALKRVPGLSVVDGKFAYVRGLGERYSSTTLNGAPLASPMPDRKVVPLDVVPSDLLESIVTAKSYSPSQPGDYAGGLVELRTKDFPTRRIFSVSASGSYNSESTFADGLRYAGGGLDLLGFDDGTRNLPDLIPTDRRIIFPNFTRTDLENFGEAFTGDWGPTPGDLPPNASLGVSFGDDLELLGRSLGVLGSLTYSNSYNNKTDVIERVFSTAGLSAAEVDYRGDETTHSVSLGGLANLSYELTPTSRITANFVYNRLMDDEARVYEGFNLDTGSDQRNYRLRFLAQTLINAQLKGEHRLGFLNNASFDWRGAWSQAGRYEPNTREVLYREEGGRFLFDNFVSSGSVFHQDLVDDTWSGAGDLEIPFTLGDRVGAIQLGGSFSAKERTAFTRRFRFLLNRGGVVTNEIRARDPNGLFNPETITRNGFELTEATFRPDNYDAQEEIRAGYAMIDTEVAGPVRIMAGARLEAATQVVTPFDLHDVGQRPLEGALLDNADILPAVNLTVELREGMNLRLAASRTLARPQLRELAPFSFADYAGGYLTIGNPELVRSLIQNYDARWEFFFAPGALIAGSAFYKTFDAPIEVAVLPSTELLKSWINGGSASNYGLEFEFRSSLGALIPALRTVSLNSNLTLVQSEVTTPDVIRIYIPGEGGIDQAAEPKTRALQGQSPYVANLSLTYASESGSSRASVLFNRFGRRIDAVGGQATAEIYEEARSQLDVVLEQRVRGGVKVKLSASRLIGNVVEYTQAGDLLRQWNNGRTVSLSFGWDTGN